MSTEQAKIETALRHAGKGYVLGVNCNHVFSFWDKEPARVGTAEQIARELPTSHWQRLSAGDDTKGPRLYDWAYCELADLNAQADYGCLDPGWWTRGLLIRRNIADGELAFFSTWCPTGTDIATLVEVEG